MGHSECETFLKESNSQGTTYNFLMYINMKIYMIPNGKKKIV